MHRLFVFCEDDQKILSTHENAFTETVNLLCLSLYVGKHEIEHVMKLLLQRSDNKNIKINGVELTFSVMSAVSVCQSRPIQQEDCLKMASN